MDTYHAAESLDMATGRGGTLATKFPLAAITTLGPVGLWGLPVAPWLRRGNVFLASTW